jgi:hypothetical protein
MCAEQKETGWTLDENRVIYHHSIGPILDLVSQNADAGTRITSVGFMHPDFSWCVPPAFALG